MDESRPSAAKQRDLRGSSSLVAVLAVALLGVGTADAAGAARTRPGSSSGSSSAPQRAVGKAQYGPSYYRNGYGYYPYGYHGYPYRYGYGFGYGYVAWPGAWWYGYPPYYVAAPGDASQYPGIIETDVKPKRATVSVDGQPLGQARDYDGSWDRLWLEPGEHVLEFSRDGYMTLRRHILLKPGMRLQIVEQLTKGTGIDPRSSSEAAKQPAPEERPASPPADPAPRMGLDRGLLRIACTPGDAAVYLDGEFLARADELARLHGALPVAVGRHRLEVVRPGYASRTLDVEVSADQPARVEVALEPAVER